jgi:hypothetical protein
MFVTFGILSFGLAMARGPAASFQSDAGQYWAGATALTNAGDFVTSGGMNLRGAWTLLFMAPAALVSQFTVDFSIYSIVLVQNALVISALGTFGIPRIVEVMTPLKWWHVGFSAITTALLFGGFAPYPLSDLYGVCLLTLGTLALLRTHRFAIFTAGLAFAAAVNIRPANIVPVVILFACWSIWRWRRLWLVAVGYIVGLAPQLALNHFAFGIWELSPPQTAALASFQLQFANSVVRYDTILSGPNAWGQFYCNPNFSKTDELGPLAGPMDLVQWILNHPAGALELGFQKISASLGWSLATPYSFPSGGGLSLFGIVVTAVSVIGFFALLSHTIARSSRARLDAGPLLLAIAVGTMAVIAVSASETRFATPLVVVGIVGLTLSLSQFPIIKECSRRQALWLLAGFACTLLAVWAASQGLTQPAPPVLWTPDLCATL